MPLAGKKGEAHELEEGLAEKEHEYQLLSQSLRLAQTDRVRYIEEMHQAIFKLKVYIEELEKEKEDLLTSLKIADSKANQIKDEKNCEDLANLGDNKDWLKEQIDEEKAIHDELDSKIREVERKLKNLQKTTGGSNVGPEMSIKAAKKMRTLQSRLSHALKRYNEILGSNTILREEIDTLRMERARFDLMYKKLDQTLTKLRQEISNTVETATVAYDQREEAHTKMIQITEKCEKDLAQHNLEMKELVRIIDHDRKLKTFMNNKALERQEDPQLTAWKAKRAKEVEEKAMAVANSIEAYEKAFDQMLELSGQDDIEKLVETFIQKEDRNYALFNYVAELNSEMDNLSEEVTRIKNDISKLERNSNKADYYHHEKMQEYETKKKELMDLIDTNETSLKSTDDCIIEIVGKVRTIFEKIGCDSTELDKKLGPKGPQTHSVLVYLSEIENRVNELLLLRNFIALHDNETIFEAKPVLIGNALTAPLSNPSIKVPIVTDDFEEETDVTKDLRPYTRAELHHKVMGTVRKKEQEAKDGVSNEFSTNSIHQGKKR